MDRIHALFLVFKEAPDADMLQWIADRSGEYSEFDPVTGKSFVAWFEYLDEADLLEIADLIDIFSGTESRYQAATGEVDENEDAIYEPVTKERFEEQKAAMMTTDKVAAIQMSKATERETATKDGDIGIKTLKIGG